MLLNTLHNIDHKIIQTLGQFDNRQFVVRLLLAIYCSAREVNNSYLSLHAKSLVYTTLISLVPLLAIGFALLKSFGVHNQIAPMLHNALEPLGEKGGEISTFIINFIDNVDVNLLGILGTVILLYTVINTIAQIEETLNHIWKLSHSRSWLRRIFYYLGVIIFTPSLVFVGLVLTASLMSTDLVKAIISMEPFGTLYYTIATLIPYIALILAFTLVYKSLPNTKVNLSAAFVGGVSATFAWKITGFGFTWFMANSKNYDLIYSGFAALIVFLLWVYISWLIFLLGGLLAYSFQNSANFNEIVENDHLENNEN